MIFRWPTMRRRRERAKRAAEERRAAIQWQRNLYYLTRDTGGVLDLGVITRERGWEMPAESLDVLRRARTGGER